jgi:hypothetical protein
MARLRLLYVNRDTKLDNMDIELEQGMHSAQTRIQ